MENECFDLKKVHSSESSGLGNMKEHPFHPFFVYLSKLAANAVGGFCSCSSLDGCNCTAIAQHFCMQLYSHSCIGFGTLSGGWPAVVGLEFRCRRSFSRISADLMNSLFRRTAG